MWLSGLSAGLRTKGLQVQFPIRAHDWVAGQVPSRERSRDNHTLMFPSLSPSLPLSKTKRNKILKKKNLEQWLFIYWTCHLIKKSNIIHITSLIFPYAYFSQRPSWFLAPVNQCFLPPIQCQEQSPLWGACEEQNYQCNTAQLWKQHGCNRPWGLAPLADCSAFCQSVLHCPSLLHCALVGFVLC